MSIPGDMSAGDRQLAPVRSKVALVTGFTGQDGTFLTRLLLDKGYKVIGLTRRVSTEPPGRVRGRFDFSAELASGRLVLEEGDLLSITSLMAVIVKHQPDEIYNLAAQSHVGTSFKQPEFTIESILMGTVNLITALETVHVGDWRMYQASTSEMYGSVRGAAILDELSRFGPTSPYAIAKMAAHNYCAMKRVTDGHFIACGILFNHESEIRGGNFVTQKIARGVRHWEQTGDVLKLGNLDSVRDWGYAGDFVQAMHAMLQIDVPTDFVVATGITHTVRDFVDFAFATIGYKVEWKGEGDREFGMVNSRIAVAVDPEFYRPSEVGYLKGNYSKAAELLAWHPETTFPQLVELMVKAAK
jgi:GDPmannose 4,6-dehydratase